MLSALNFIILLKTKKHEKMATNVYDIAKYILVHAGPMSTMKLQKLVYYSQAWSLVWDEKPLFENEIQAWAGGPVSPDLYEAHRGLFMINAAELPVGDDRCLDQEQRETVNAVLRDYSGRTGQWLSDLTHMESPWLDARQGLLPNERANRVISHASMAEYYSSL